MEKVVIVRSTTLWADKNRETQPLSVRSFQPIEGGGVSDGDEVGIDERIRQWQQMAHGVVPNRFDFVADAIQFIPSIISCTVSFLLHCTRMQYRDVG